MKLSILDQSPISTNQTANEALQESMNLARIGETLGYSRYWIAEHHAMPGLACSAPEVMLGYIGANTKNIRIGSGAVLLPYYKPYKVAETYHMLSTLFPNRIDVGIGRAPGGPAEATNALSDNYLQHVYKMPDLVNELIKYIDNEGTVLEASPLPLISPDLWMLGTSRKSGDFAAENGLAYSFGQFMSDENGAEIVQQYRQSFKPRKKGQKPYVIMALSVICAETTQKAEEIALSSIVWELQNESMEGNKGVPSVDEAKKILLNLRNQKSIERIKKKMIIGTPNEVKSKILEIQSHVLADEIMIVTITYSPKDKHQSYRLIAEQFIK
ncbi:LLM class flavin-dependent oxidoreductase [Cytobacillus firmus]|uniref:LLM class flavin-dependent oxidoreductase n=1 Tax=Cytobacillus firmus TaxID=1399 RepID=UPI0018CEA797|nr:LLM class flavin-dependent oxidoreductase [Cytobacillus firmus]MBG9656974.1 luciferase [Cytobacillus firmus]MED1906423.1 LLM class flavin-dependent oxidoreductase [Cytobacillus firmus]